MTVRSYLIGLLCLLASNALGQVETITVHSGNGPPAPVNYCQSSPDSEILVMPGASMAAMPAFTAADFAQYGFWQAATIVTPYPGWLNLLPCDDGAQWVSSGLQTLPNGTCRPSDRSALYAIPFTVQTQCICTAELQFCFAADDVLGSPANEPNRPGLYLLNEQQTDAVALPGTSWGGNLGSQSILNLNVTGLIHPGLNMLFVYARDTGGVVSGVMFSATFTISPSGTLDIFKFADLNCNGVHDVDANPPEPTLSGWSFVVSNDATGQQFTSSPTVGGWTHVCVPSGGTYSVVELPQSNGYEQTCPHCTSPTRTVDCVPGFPDSYVVVFGNCRCDTERLREHLSTGHNNDTHSVMTAGSQDSDTINSWTLISAPAGVPVGGPAIVRNPHAAWVDASPGSAWIGPNPMNSNPNGHYVYQTCFCLREGFSNPELTLCVRADDSATAFLNGQFLGAWPGWGSPCAPAVVVNDPNMFRPGENCLTIDVHNAPQGFSPTGLDVVANIVAEDGRCCTEPCPCTEHPSGLVGWWPLEESSGTTTKNIAGFQNDGVTRSGAWVGPINSGGPAPIVGRVGNGMGFNANTNGISFVNVSNSPTLNVGFGNFSIDAWIRVPAWVTAPYLPIVNKTFVNFSQLSALGYSMHLSNLRLTASLEIMPISQGFGPVSCTAGPPLNDDQWHHVAMTVNRNSTTGLTLYLDGIPLSPVDATPMAVNLNNSAPFRIGADNALPVSYFQGDIDEVEFFNRALTAAEVFRIHKAGSSGKCKEDCHACRFTPLYAGQTTTGVCVRITNNNSTAQTYTVTPGPGISGPGCSSIPVPAFTPTSSVVTVGPNATQSACFSVPNPFSADLETSCFCFNITIVATGHAFQCCSYLIDCRSTIIFSEEGCGGDNPTPLQVQPGASITLPLDLINAALPIGDLPYRFEVLVHGSDERASAIHLNNLLPGEAADGVAQLPAPGGSVPLSVDLTLDNSGLNEFHELIFSIDRNADGVYEPLHVTAISPQPPTDCNGNGIPDQTELDLGQAVDCNTNGTPDECDVGNQVATQGFAATPADWSFLGAACYSAAGQSARLVSAGQALTAGALYYNGGPVTESIWSVEWDWLITDVRATYADQSGQTGPDGLTMFVTQTPPEAAGGTGIGLGYSGFAARSWAIEFDAYQNADSFDPDSNHVGLNVGGSVVSIASNHVSPDFETPGIWHSRVVTSGARVSVYVTPPGGSESQVLDATVPTANSSAAMYIGFTSGNGLNTATVEIDNAVIRMGIRDCNANGIPDECDTAGGTNDCNTNFVPDECEPDCNTNGFLDVCDIAAVASNDCNTNSIPDECEGGGPFAQELFSAPPAGWTFLGAASHNANDRSARLVSPGQPSTAGAVCHIGAPVMENIWSVEWDWLITNVTSNNPDQSGRTGPNGFTMYVAEAPPTQAGGIGIGLGYSGFAPRSWAIEFDAYHNANSFDPDSNHVGLDVGGSVVSITSNHVSPDFETPGVWHSRVVKSGARVSVYVTPPDGSESQVLDASVPAANDPATMYIGFSSGNGLGSAAVDIDNVVIHAGIGDCNRNGILDACDIGLGTSLDLNGDGIPDECQTPRNGDLNNDGLVDAADIQPFIDCLFAGDSTGTCARADLNADGVVDLDDARTLIPLLILTP